MVAELTETLAIYLRLVAAQGRAQMQYRVSFALQVVGSFALSFVDFIAVLVIFAHVPYLAGWSLGEVAFLYGTSYLSFRLTDLLVGELDGLPQLVQRGDFDLVLTRPLSSLLQAITTDFSLRRTGAVLQGAIVFGVALSLVDVDWTALRALMTALTLVSAVGIFAAIWIVGATTTFWTVRTYEILNSFTYGGNQLTSYPMNIYAGWLRRFVIFVVPLAFVNYFPALYVLGKRDPLDAPGFVRFLSPLVAIALLLVARWIWGYGVRHYRSTGS
jgi:ABC-2 type transport system permease protein